MWSSPLKEPKIKADKEEQIEIKKFKKPKPIISRASIKKLTGVKSVDLLGCQWADRWVMQLIQENAYPPQLLSADFESMLGKYFEIKTALSIIERFRTDYRNAFALSLGEQIELSEPDNLAWIVDVLRSDPNVIRELPPNYLG
jgi:hypothetical protein